jgi:hypothetical protein
MEKLQHQYGADALSEALDVSESGFAAHRGKQNGERWKEDAELRASDLLTRPCSGRGDEEKQ